MTTLDSRLSNKPNKKKTSEQNKPISPMEESLIHTCSYKLVYSNWDPKSEKSPKISFFEMAGRAQCTDCNKNYNADTKGMHLLFKHFLDDHLNPLINPNSLESIDEKNKWNKNCPYYEMCGQTIKTAEGNSETLAEFVNRYNSHLLECMASKFNPNRSFGQEEADLESEAKPSFFFGSGPSKSFKHARKIPFVETSSSASPLSGATASTPQQIPTIEPIPSAKSIFDGLKTWKQKYLQHFFTSHIKKQQCNMAL